MRSVIFSKRFDTTIDTSTSSKTISELLKRIMFMLHVTRYPNAIFEQSSGGTSRARCISAIITISNESVGTDI